MIFIPFGNKKVVHKKFAYRDGKRYGPYFYENKRVDGKVVTNYLGKGHIDGKSSRRKLYSFLLIVLAVIGILAAVYLLSPDSPTGRVTIDTSVRYEVGEVLDGNVKFNIKEGELVPLDSKVIVQLGSEKKEFVLSDIVIEEIVQGNFYAENSELVGLGSGYGVEGQKIIYPEIKFELRAFREDTGSSRKEEAEQKVEEPKQNDTEKEKEDKEKEPKQNDTEKDKGGKGVTGNVVAGENESEEIVESDNVSGNAVKENENIEKKESEGNQIVEKEKEQKEIGEQESEGNETEMQKRRISGDEYIVSGRASKDKDFTIEIEPGYGASILRGSVEANGKKIKDNSVSVRESGREVTVSTEYFIAEKGFGPEYLGEYALALRVDLEKLNISAREGILSVRLEQNGVWIASQQAQIFVREGVGEAVILNGSNASLTFGLIKEIPAVRIEEGGVGIIALEEYFVGAERYEFVGENISAEVTGQKLILNPDTGFKGTRTGKVIAYSGEQSVESNEFSIVVSTIGFSIQTSREKIRVGEKVKWRKNVSLETPEELIVEVPAIATNINVVKIEDGVESEAQASITGNSITGQVTIDIDLRKEPRIVKWFKNLMRAITGRAIDVTTSTNLANESIDVLLQDSAKEYLIEYETPAPESVEEETKQGKIVTVTGPDEIVYEDVIAFVSLNNSISVEGASGIRVYWYNYDFEENESEIKEVDEVADFEVVEEIREEGTTGSSGGSSAISSENNVNNEENANNISGNSSEIINNSIVSEENISVENNTIEVSAFGIPDLSILREINKEKGVAGLQVGAYHPTLSGSTPDTSKDSGGLLPSTIIEEDVEYLNVSDNKNKGVKVTPKVRDFFTDYIVYDMSKYINVNDNKNKKDAVGIASRVMQNAKLERHKVFTDNIVFTDSNYINLSNNNIAGDAPKLTGLGISDSILMRAISVGVENPEATLSKDDNGKSAEKAKGDVGSAINVGFEEETTEEGEVKKIIAEQKTAEKLQELAEKKREKEEKKKSRGGVEGVDYRKQEIPFKAYDSNGDGNVDYIEWVVPHLSSQVFEIILITKAEHLDSNRTFIENVYELVKTRDGNYSTIPAGDYLRVTFEKNLTSEKDITIYAKSNNSGSIKVYEKDGTEQIADFGTISEDTKYRVLLTNLGQGECYDDKTEILTENGWKLFVELGDEKVATLNQDSGELEWEKPKERQEFENGGKMYRIELEDVNHKLNLLTKSFVLYTGTSDCSKNFFSPDQIGQFNLSANAKYGTSFLCGDSSLAFKSLSENSPVGTDSICNLSNSINRSNSSCEKPESFLSLCAFFSLESSSNNLDGAYNLTLSENNSSIFLVCNPLPLDIIVENNSLASTTKSIIYNSGNSFLSSLSIDSSISEANNFAFSSVNFDLDASASNVAFCNTFDLDKCISNNLAITSSFINLDKSTFEDSMFSFNSEGISNLITISAMGEGIDNNYINITDNEEDNSLVVSPEHRVYARINDGEFKLMAIKEVYKLAAHNEVYFLDGAGIEMKVDSITIENYSGKIYGVDVENDIVLVRRGGESATALWSGNSEGYSQDTFDLGVSNGDVEFDYVVDPIGDTNTWICNDAGKNFSTAACWSLGSVPVAGENIVFNISGTGNVNITNNTMPQDLNSFTVVSGYNGTILFNGRFAVGAWGSASLGTQEWNVTNNISIGGGIMNVSGDYMNNTNCCNLTEEGHGQIWRSVSGNITVHNGGRIDGTSLGFPAVVGPGAGGTNLGATHGGKGSQNKKNPYGNATAPTSLGSGGSSRAGGSAVKLEANSGTVQLDGILIFTASGSSGISGCAAGGSIWLKANKITGVGTLNVTGGNCVGTNARGGGGGRIRLESGTITYTGIIDTMDGKGGNGDPLHGTPGTLTFSNNTYPNNWTINGTFALLGGNYGEGNVTNVLGDFIVPVGQKLYVYGDCYANATTASTAGCYNTTTEGRGVWLNASGNITVLGTIDGIGLGFPLGFGPGAGGSNLGATHGGKGGQSAKGAYGNATAPTSLGSGGENTGSPINRSGGAAVKLETGLGVIEVNGTIVVGGGADSASGCPAGGSIWLKANKITGVGTLNAAGGYCVGTNARGGGGGRIRLESGTITYTGIINASGGAGGGGNIVIYATPGTLTFSNNTWPNNWTINGTFALLGGNYGEGNVTNVLGDFIVPVGQKLYVYGDCYANATTFGCYNTTTEGRGVWLNASGNITVLGTIDGIGLGFPSKFGPGAGGDNLGATHGGKGGQSAKNPYGDPREPTSLGSGGVHSIGIPRSGGAAVKLETTLGVIEVNGSILVGGANDTTSGCPSGGSIWLYGDIIRGNGSLIASGSDCPAGRAGGGGRIAITGGEIGGSIGNISVSGGNGTSNTVHGSGGTVFINVSGIINSSMNVSAVSGSAAGGAAGGFINISGTDFTFTGSHITARGNATTNGTIQLDFCTLSIPGATFIPNYTQTVYSGAFCTPPAGDTTKPAVTINFPAASGRYNIANLPLIFNISLNEGGSALYSLDSGVNNVTMFNTSNNANKIGTLFNATNNSIADGTYTINYYANDTSDNRNFTELRTFSVDMNRPTITINFPAVQANYSSSNLPLIFNISLNEGGSALYSLDSGVNNVTMFNTSNNANKIGTLFNATNGTIADGTYTINYYANDSYDNRNFTESRVFTYDTTAPVVTLRVPSNDTTISASTGTLNMSFNATFTDNLGLHNVTFYLYNATMNVVNTSIRSVLGTSGSVNLTVELNSTGTYYWNYLAADRSNNRAFNATNWTFTFSAADTTVPAVTINFPAASGRYNIVNLPLIFNISTNEKSSALYSLDSGVNNVTMFNTSANSDRMGILFNASNNSIADGTYTINYYANDTSDNRNFTELRTFSVDMNRPTVTINFPAVQANYSSSNLPLIFNISLNEGGSALYSLDSGVNNVTMFNTSANSNKIGTLFNATNGTIADGTYTINYYANDSYDNRNFTESRVFTYDTTAPVVLLIGPANGTTYSDTKNTMNVSFNATFSDNLGLRNVTFYLYNATMDILNTSIRSVLGTSGSVNLTVELNYSGTFFWNYLATDRSNNKAFNLTNFTFIFSTDTTAPNVTINFPSNNSRFGTSNLPLNFNVTLHETGSALYSLDDGVNNLTMKSTTDGSSLTGTLFNASNNSIAGGTYILRIYANDSFDNRNFTQTRTFIFDSLAPNVTMNFPASNGLYSLKDLPLNFNITLTEAGSALYSLDSGVNNITMVNTSDNANKIGTLFNYSNSSIASGRYTIRFYANDTAGNNNFTENRAFTFDGSAPTVNFTGDTPADASTQSYSSIVINVTSNDSNDHYTFVDLNKDVLLWLRFNATNSSGDPLGESSYGNNGSLISGAIVNSTGYFGNGSHFDGVNDYIAGSIAGQLSPNQGAFSLWAKFSTGALTDSAARAVIGVGTASGTANTITITKNATNNLVFRYNNLGTSYDVGIISMTGMDSWHHYMMTWNSSTLTAYRNGTLVGSATLTSTTTAMDQFRIGARGNNAVAQFFNGSIDEVIVFNRTLNAQEATALFNASASGNKYYRNFTSLSDRDYNFTAYSVDYLDNRNETAQRGVTIEVSTSADRCGSLNDANSVYTLQNDVSATGDCFTVTANNITLNLAGYNVTGDADSVSDDGVLIIGYNGTVIKNGKINDFGAAISSTAGYNTTVRNMSIRHNSAIGGDQDIRGIYISGGKWHNITSNNFTYMNSTGLADIDGIHLVSTSDSLVQNNSFSDIGAQASEDAIGIELGASADNNTLTGNTFLRVYERAISISGYGNVITNGRIENSKTDGIEFDIAAAANTNITNITIVRDGGAIGYDLRYSATGANGTYLIDMPHIANYSFGTGTKGQKINIRKTNYGDIQFLDNINGSGTNLTSDIRIGNNSANITIGQIGLNRSANITLYGIGIRDFGANVKILRDGIDCGTSCANFTALNANTVSFNVTTSGNYSIDDVSLLTACGTLSSTNVIYTLQNAVSATGTCFTIAANNVTLNGAGYLINYSQSSEGNAIINYPVGGPGYNLTTIRNLTIVQGGSSSSAIGIRILDGFNSTIANVSVTTFGTSAHGIQLDGGNNTIINSTITTSGTEASGIDLTDSNTIVTNITITTTGVGGDGVSIGSGSRVNVIENLTITTSGNQSAGYLVSGSRNSISGGSVNATKGESIYVSNINAVDNNFTNISLSGGIDYAHLRIDSSSNFDTVNGTYLIDMPYIGNYTFTGTSVSGILGGTLNIKKTGFGEVRFIQVVNGSGTNLTSDIRIGNNSANITIGNIGLNRTANITFYSFGDRGISNPKVLRNGFTCGECYNFTTLTANTVVFNTSWAGNYSIGAHNPAPVVDTTAPNVNFTGETILSGATQSYSAVIVNVTSNDSNDHYTFVELNKDVLLWLRFNATNSSGDPLDESSYITNGSLISGTIVNSTGYFGNGSHFDGVNDYISGSIAGQMSPNQGAFSLWAKFSTGSLTDSAARAVIGVGTASGTANTITITKNGTNNLVFRYNNLGTVYDVGIISMTGMDSWHHYMMTWNSSTLTVYRNGTLVGSATLTPTTTAMDQFRIGARGNNAVAQFFNGSADEVIVFNRTLNAQEATALFNASASGNKYYNNITLTEKSYDITAYAVDSADNRNQTGTRTATLDFSNLGECATLETTNRVYTLQKDVSTATTCLTVTANNITVNLAGYNITGDANSVSDYGVSITGYNGTVIKNGKINDFGAAISSTAGYNTTVRNMSIRHNSAIGGDQDIRGIFLSGGKWHNITSNNFTYMNSTGLADIDGIHLVSTSDSLVQNNSFSDIGAQASEDAIGIELGASADNNTLTGNTFLRVYERAIRVNGYGNVITNGRIENSKTDAIEIDAIAAANTNITNVTIVRDGGAIGYDLIFGAAGANGTYLIDMPYIANYSFGIGHKGQKINIKNTHGEIKYLASVNGTGTNLTSDIVIGNNSVNISTTQIGLNRTANITFYNLGSRGFGADARALRDGVVCAECYNFTSLEANSAIMNVSTGGVYKIGDGVIPRVSFGIGVENDNEFAGGTSINVTVSVTETNEGNVVFRLFNDTGNVNTTIFGAGNRTLNFTGLGISNYTYNVTVNDSFGNVNTTISRNLTLLPSCLNIGGCTEGGACNITANCYLYNDLCSGSVCDFSDFQINRTLRTLYNETGDGRALTLNLSGNITFFGGNRIIFSGRNGSDISGNVQRGGNGGILNISVPRLFNTTNANITGIGGYTTASSGAGGNGGIFHATFLGTFNNWTSTAASRTYININGSGSTSGVNGTAGNWIRGRKTTGVTLRDVDVDGDGDVDSIDVTAFRNRYRNVSTDGTFITERDINVDGIINVEDLARIGFEIDTRG